MENSKIAALVELGILCRGEQIPATGDGAVDPGPHRYSAHNQLCRYEHPKFHHPYENPALEAYSLFGPKLTMARALARTRLVILLGVADSEEFRQCVASPQTVVILFEPDERVLTGFLERTRLAGLNRDNFFCFTGDPRSFDPPLQEMLPGELFRVGTPAVFLTDRVREHYADWAHQVIAYMEILHYRHAIYGLSGQALARSRPLRDIHRGLIYDQQRHVYENIPDYLTAPDISQLKNRFPGTQAILVAAGPDLPERFDYIRRNRDRALVICVNNALKPLAEAGIKPHFTVINDTSIASGQVFRRIPPQPGTILVGHCLSELGGDTFQQKYLFGSILPKIFGEREELRLHGSVISTAFSLARHLGCSRCILVGAQLASDNPWKLGYAKGTLKDRRPRRDKPLTNAYPQLYPVTTPFGGQLYTTLNFLDAALWLSEEIRVSDLPCVNTSKASILYGRGIEYGEEPEIELGQVPLTRTMADLFRPEPPAADPREALKFLRHEAKLWVSVRDTAKALLADTSPAMNAKGMIILNQLDRNNVTYLVERTAFSGERFDVQVFYDLVFRGGEKERTKGLKGYFRSVRALSEEFLGIIDTVSRSL